VQIYDPARDTWSTATPIPGAPVFGHAGAIVRDAIVYVDGVRVNRDRPRFTIEAASWRGDIDPENPTSISWTRLQTHPGPPLYRAAAGGLDEWALFAGGTDNPYNYNGIGYDGVPARPVRSLLGFNVTTGTWTQLAPLPLSTMDHRGMVTMGGTLAIVGGMRTHQAVSSGVLVTTVERVRALVGR
jgi:N-acetylneuraminic acid mutarotase